MEKVDAVVIGAGVVGLAVGRELARQGHDTLVLERELQIGTGVSSRNSEVIHAGLYYPTGSLKARLCVEGRKLLYDYCESHGVAHQRCGKLVVATDERQIDGLRTLGERARANGVTDLAWLSRAEARSLEPELQCTAALLSPSTGIIDSHGLMLSLQGELEAHGGLVSLGSSVERLYPVDGGWRLLVRTADELMELQAGIVVNAAGLWAPLIAEQTTGLATAYRPRARYSKGCYFSLTGKSPFSRLVYPMPQDAWLGVHLTLDLAGAARFGPDTEWVEPPASPAELDYSVAPGRADGFYADVRRYWPGLRDGVLTPAYSGIRPKIHAPHEPAPDFRIDGPQEHGLPGLVNLLGIESPGLTSSLALATEVVTRLSSVAS